jgi:hypothetical protein
VVVVVTTTTKICPIKTAARTAGTFMPSL